MPPPSFTRGKFRTEAKPLPVVIGGMDLEAKPVEMQTGSMGFRATGRRKMFIGNCYVDVQISAVVTVIGSKVVS